MPVVFWGIYVHVIWNLVSKKWERHNWQDLRYHRDHTQTSPLQITIIGPWNCLVINERCLSALQYILWLLNILTLIFASTQNSVAAILNFSKIMNAKIISLGLHSLLIALFSWNNYHRVLKLMFLKNHDDTFGMVAILDVEVTRFNPKFDLTLVHYCLSFW